MGIFHCNHFETNIQSHFFTINQKLIRQPMNFQFQFHLPALNDIDELAALPSFPTKYFGKMLFYDSMIKTGI